MKSRAVQRALAVAGIVLGVLLLAGVVALIILHVRTAALRDDHAPLFDNEKYRTAVSIDGIDAITQDVSCGYAVLEMFSDWCGHDVTEESLYEDYGKVVTSTGRAFCDEMNKQFPEYRTTMHTYLTDTELIDRVYDSLAQGIPVPIEWAAKYGDEWTLHYSLVTGMDIPNDTVTVANPYGYVEKLTVEEFLARTRFDAFENMPLYLRLGFAFGMFEKNTVFLPQPAT